jgi:ribonucleotide reductase alpha subunit
MTRFLQLDASKGGVGIGTSSLNNSQRLGTMIDVYINLSDQLKRGAAVLCIAIDDPQLLEILRFKELRKPGRWTNLNVAILFKNEFFKQQLISSEYWFFIKDEQTPHLFGNDYSEYYIKHKKNCPKIEFSKLFELIRNVQQESGNPYLINVDQANSCANNIKETQETELQESITHTNVCGEIYLPCFPGETPTCILSTLNLKDLYINGQFSTKQMEHTVFLQICFLNAIIDNMAFPRNVNNENTTKKFRPIGLGVCGYQDLLLKLNVEYENSQNLAALIASHLYYYAIKASNIISGYLNVSVKNKITSEGIFHFESFLQQQIEKSKQLEALMINEKVFIPKLPWNLKAEHGLTPISQEKWNSLRFSPMANRNLIALMPTEGTSLILNIIPSITALVAKMQQKNTMVGSFRLEYPDVKTSTKTVWELGPEIIEKINREWQVYVDQGISFNRYGADEGVDQVLLRGFLNGAKTISYYTMIRSKIFEKKVVIKMINLLNNLPMLS